MSSKNNTHIIKDVSSSLVSYLQSPESHGLSHASGRVHEIEVRHRCLRLGGAGRVVARGDIEGGQAVGNVGGA